MPSARTPPAQEVLRVHKWRSWRTRGSSCTSTSTGTVEGFNEVQRWFAELERAPPQRLYLLVSLDALKDRRWEEADQQLGRYGIAILQWTKYADWIIDRIPPPLPTPLPGPGHQPEAGRSAGQLVRAGLGRRHGEHGRRDSRRRQSGQRRNHGRGLWSHCRARNTWSTTLSLVTLLLPRACQHLGRLRPPHRRPC